MYYVHSVRIQFGPARQHLSEYSWNEVGVMGCKEMLSDEQKDKHAIGRGNLNVAYNTDRLYISMCYQIWNEGPSMMQTMFCLSGGFIMWTYLLNPLV